MKDINSIIAAFALLFLSVTTSWAQDSNDVKLLKPRLLKRFGHNAALQGDYSASAMYYKQYMKLKPQKHKIAFKLAESYRNVRDYKMAQEWYLKAYEKSGKENALALYYYALMLKQNGDYVKAKENLLKFKKESGSSPKYKLARKQMKNELIGCDSAKGLINKPLKVNIMHMDTSINKVHVESSPLPLSDSTLVYAALRTSKKEYITSDDSMNYPVRKFYLAEKRNNKWHYKGEFPGPFNQSGVNTSNGALSPDGKRFYFTQCQKNWQNKVICSIYVSEQENGQWSTPKLLDKSINNPKYTSTQPTVAIEDLKKNEVVYFVSNRPGGKGGLDIWYTIYDFNKKIYRKPRNAGSKVNSSSDEMSPNFDADTKTLYFSSNGWPGLGGFDIFKATGEMSRFTAAVNVGSPINSGSDDLYYTEGKNREEGFFVSNRSGGVALKNETCCDDLYSFKRLEYVKLAVYGSINETSTYAPIPEGNVSLYMLSPLSPEPLFIKTIRTDAQGNYRINVEAGNDYKLVFSKDGYLSGESKLSTKSYTQSQSIQKNLTLNSIPKDAITLKNVYYETDKFELKKNSQAAIDTTLLRLLIENPQLVVEVSSHTDYRGSDAYNLKLSQNRAESVVKYLISKGINKQRVIAKGYGESAPLAPNKNADGTDNAEGMEKNRRTEFKIIGKMPQLEIEYED